MIDAASGAVDLGTLLQRLHLGPSSSTATETHDAEVLRAPLAFFARAFREVSQGRRAEDLCEDWGAAERLLASLNPLGGWEAVPLLSSLREDEVHSGRLVRYRGMVQDMFDPEFYISVYEQEAAGGRVRRVHATREGRSFGLTVVCRNSARACSAIPSLARCEM